MLKMRTLIIILTFISYTFSYGQSILIPGQGIQGDSIRINEATIFQAIKKYGDNFEKTETELLITYTYKSLGISFSIHPYDSNHLIREISFEFQFKAQTNNGVILNKTTWKELEIQYGFKGGFTGGGSYVYIPFDGGAYYLNKNPKKQGWNDNDTIFKIEISDRQVNGTSERINYAYNINLEIQSIEGVYKFINGNPSLTKLTDYFKSPAETFAPRLMYINNRIISEGIDQSEICIEIGSTTYDFNILTRSDTIFYLQSRTWHKDSVLFEYRNDTLLTNCIKQHNDFYQTSIDILNENSFITEKFVYGFGCGWAGTEPVKRNELNFLLSKQDYQIISQWLRSMNPEIQAYGLEGMYMLSKSGLKLTLKDIEIMEYLVNKPFNIYACRGCIYGIDKHYADIVSPKAIRQMKKHWR